MFFTGFSSVSFSFWWLSYSTSWCVNLWFLLCFCFNIYLFDRHTAQPTTVSTLSGHSSWVLSVAFSSDNQHLISSYVLLFLVIRNIKLEGFTLVHRINRLKFGIQKQNDAFIHQLNIPIKYGVFDSTIRVHNLYQCHKTKV